MKLGMEGVQETAGKIAVERKLQDEGEQVYNTLKQQEEMRISGKSARQMVMQKLMGARGEVRGKEDSVVLLLKNMVRTETSDGKVVQCPTFSCVRLVLTRSMKSSMMKSNKSVESMERWRMLSSTRRNKMTPKRQRCMSKFLSNSTRASRPRRQRTALMEDILVDGRCQL